LCRSSRAWSIYLVLCSRSFASKKTMPQIRNQVESAQTSLTVYKKGAYPMAKSEKERIIKLFSQVERGANEQ
ncbi:MAG: hypothetical protein KGJ80_15235, partial [Chloroflexota bacterium]|nr:hypothetical protein [Chloroflexota bacterium]